MLRSISVALLVPLLLSAVPTTLMAQSGTITGMSGQVNSVAGTIYTPGDYLRGGASASVSSPSATDFRLCLTFLDSSANVAADTIRYENGVVPGPVAFGTFVGFTSASQMSGNWYDFYA